MSLANFSLPFQLATPAPYIYPPVVDQQSPISNLRLNAVVPGDNFGGDRRYQNEPYIPPAAYHQQGPQTPGVKQQQQQQSRPRQYYKQQVPQQQQFRSQNVPRQEIDSSQENPYSYDQNLRRTQARHQGRLPQQQTRPPPAEAAQQDNSRVAHASHAEPEPYPERPDGYTRVNGASFAGPGAKTSVHAVLDYDEDEEDEEADVEDYYDETIPSNGRVTPIQGPIYLKNGSVPVVPLYSYPQLNNGTFLQIPILWTALSVALGVELRGDLVRGTPCIKKYHQLFCPTAGNTYPIERIELFIDENKALMKRMYGDFEMTKEYGPETSSSPRRRKKRSFEEHDIPDGGPSAGSRQPDPRFIEGGDSFFDKVRRPRQSFSNKPSETGRVDACESKVEIVTPYWASNSAGKIRAIVNTQHFEQAIHQEVCSKTHTNRCNGDCGCEQKYKWHRLLAYDPDNDCKGIFMDWFLFPSCCVCRCDPHGKFPGTSSTPSTQRG